MQKDVRVTGEVRITGKRARKQGMPHISSAEVLQRLLSEPPSSKDQTAQGTDSSVPSPAPPGAESEPSQADAAAS